METTTTSDHSSSGSAPDLAGRIWDLLSTGDPALADLLADDIVLRASGSSPWSGEFRTRARVVDYFNEVMTSFPNTSLELRDTLTSEHRVAYLVRLRIEREGRCVEDDSTWTMTVDHGLVTRWELNDDDQYAMDAFWRSFPESARRT
jgi:ketosteroid isomerase-like protein